MQRVARIGQIAPDGVPLDVPLSQLKVSESFFLPCLNTDKAKKDVAKLAKDYGFKVSVRVRSERNLYGIRVWRIR